MADEARNRQIPPGDEEEVSIDETALAEDVSNTDIPDIEEPAQAEPREADQILEQRTGTNPDEELDFTDDIGTTDAIEVVSEGDTYFPPADPVVEPYPESTQHLQVVDGWAPTSDTAPIDTEEVPDRVELGDDELAQEVYTELQRDSMTIDLDIRVFVRNGVAHLHGVVNSLDEAEAAEEVAARVPGILEVEEELEIVPQAQMSEQERDHLQS
ncbi:MAG: BON domain-containing protein [Chloroflexi bacterium]|nr:BON domain-containing protein [Chloroflexota bacterium]